MPLLVRAFELNSRMNIIEIIDEYIQTILTSSSDHENIIDISPPCVRLPRSIRESIDFEHAHAKKRLAKEGAIFVPIAASFCYCAYVLPVL